MEKSEVNIFQKFRKNKLIKDENSVKSSSNIGDKHPYQIIMELNQTRNLAENFYKMDDGFEKDKRAMTAFDGKRDAIFSNFNNREQEMMEKGVICNFLQQGNFQNFPNFSEHRPNTTGCDSKLRRKFTIKDLE